MKMIEDRISALTAEKEDLMKEYLNAHMVEQRIIENSNMRISMEISFLNKLNESEFTCKHRWYRTTKNYKSVKKCCECGEIKEGKDL